MNVVLEVKGGSKKIRKIRLKSEETIVGRRHGCDLRIPSSAVSRRHCRLSFREGYLTVEDLDSSNGTYVNGVRITKQVVRPGDTLDIGPLSLVVKYQLSQAAIDRLLEEGTIEAGEVVPAPEPAAAEKRAERKPAQTAVTDANTGKEEAAARRKLTKHDAPAKKSAKKGKKDKKEAASAKKHKPAPPTMVYDGELSLHLPPPEDLRDILSQMEDS